MRKIHTVLAAVTSMSVTKCGYTTTQRNDDGGMSGP